MEKYDYYADIIISVNFETYDFISAGIKGDIRKRIKFSLVQAPDVYNLAFGDLMEDGEIDDYCITDNKDTAKILATVAAATQLFLGKYPDSLIAFTGSNIERTRLYRMAIGNNLDELLAENVIYGVEKNGSIDSLTRN